LDRIEEAATRMTQLISNLLDVARLKLDHPLDLDRQPTDLVALTQQVAQEQRLTVDRQRIVVEVEVPELVGLWDPVRLERVLRNLLANAVKYSPDGGRITIVIRQEATPTGDWIVIQVTDSGIGIPPADQAAIFIPFHRGGNVIGRIEGTGVGLASAKQIVEQHGGTITVTSEEGRGSTFTIRLPLVV
jgi:signal transduction histidine kinase